MNNEMLDSVRKTHLAEAPKYEYRYPGPDLTPGTEIHDRLVKEIRVRAQEAQDVMRQKHPVWREIEKTMSVFVDLTATEKTIKSNSRKPVPIVIPAGFAMVETFLSFLVKAFLDNPPLHPLEPQEPDDSYGTILLEMLLEWQCQQMRGDLAAYRMFRDALTYGFGVITPRWRSEYGWQPRRPTLADNLRQFFNANYRPPDEWSVLAEGHENVNIDPRLYWPDPNVPIDQPQKAEFISWMELTQTTNLLEWEKSSNGDIFNCRYLRHIDARSQLMEELGENIENVVPAGGDTTPQQTTHPAHVLWMYINLIPKAWNLGDDEYPQKWLFGLAGDSVLIQARPQGLRHNRFPVAVAAPDSNGRDVTPISRLELVMGITRYADWLIAAQMEAQRVDVNGRFLIDPSLVNMHDMADTTRRFIRARRSQWGKGNLADAIQQFKTSTATADNVNMASIMIQLLKETSGASDNMQGLIQTRGERRSATEARGANLGAMAKMERYAWMIARQAMRDLGYLMASQTQQLMSRGTYLRIVGSREQELQREYGQMGKYVFAGPMDLQVRFDCIARDGSIPSGDYADTWLQMFQAISGDPELRQLFDVPRVFMHLGRMLGAKDVQRFIRDGGNVMPMIVPDQVVADQMAQGNLAPVSEAA